MKFKYNPNNYIDNYFIDLLFTSIILDNSTMLSDALVYKNIGNGECEDCGKIYYYCKCEGGRERNSRGESQPCEECGMNYCLCDYEIDENVKLAAIKIAKKYLSKDQITILRDLLIRQMNAISENTYQESIESLKTCIKMLNNNKNEI